MERMFEVLVSAVTPEGMAVFLFHGILLVMIYAHSRMDARRDSRPGTDPNAGITITNNIYCAPRRRRRKTVRHRRGRPARRRSLRRQER